MDLDAAEGKAHIQISLVGEGCCYAWLQRICDRKRYGRVTTSACQILRHVGNMVVRGVTGASGFVVCLTEELKGESSRKKKI